MFNRSMEIRANGWGTDEYAPNTVTVCQAVSRPGVRDGFLNCHSVDPYYTDPYYKSAVA